MILGLKGLNEELTLTVRGACCWMIEAGKPRVSKNCILSQFPPKAHLLALLMKPNKAENAVHGYWLLLSSVVICPSAHVCGTFHLLFFFKN